MKKKIIICLIILLIVVAIFFIIPKSKENGSEDKIPSLPINYVDNEEIKNSKDEENNNEVELENDNSSEEKEKIEQITKEQGIQGDSSFYELITEYDGRETITVKPWIKYQVALTGIIKKDKPEFSQMDELLLQAPNHTGIWISENSRDNFLKILKQITKADYQITEDGYLIQKTKSSANEYDDKITKMLQAEKLYVFDINSISYLVDEVTGEIQEYPFEEMDPYTGFEYFETENKQMYIISENKMGKINQEEVLKEILGE